MTALNPKNKIQPTFRPAEMRDAELVLGFIRELAEYEKLAHEVVATSEHIKKTFFCSNPRVHGLIAEVSGMPVGFAVYFYNYSTFQGKHGIYIEDIYVREGYRGMGIGKKFFQQICQIALTNDCGRVQWWVLNWNKPSIDFYERLDAKAMDEWTVYRLEGDAINQLVEETR